MLNRPDLHDLLLLTLLRYAPRGSGDLRVRDLLRAVVVGGVDDERRVLEGCSVRARAQEAEHEEAEKHDEADAAHPVINMQHAP